ncbi:unnamed protein product [Boreogadus saida]
MVCLFVACFAPSTVLLLVHYLQLRAHAAAADASYLATSSPSTCVGTGRSGEPASRAPLQPTEQGQEARREPQVNQDGERAGSDIRDQCRKLALEAVDGRMEREDA